MLKKSFDISLHLLFTLPYHYCLCRCDAYSAVHIFSGTVFLQPSLEESPFNPLRGKQIDHPHVYLKKSYDSLKKSCD